MDDTFSVFRSLLGEEQSTITVLLFAASWVKALELGVTPRDVLAFAAEACDDEAWETLKCALVITNYELDMRLNEEAA